MKIKRRGRKYSFNIERKKPSVKDFPEEEEEKDITKINCDDASADEIIPATEEKAESPFLGVEIKETNQSSCDFNKKPREKEVIAIKYPFKIEIFIPNPELSEKIKDGLNGTENAKMSSKWCTSKNSTMVGAIGETGKIDIKKIISPFIEKIMKNFYKDGN